MKLNAILKSFNKTITQLETFIAKSAEDIKQNTIKVTELQRQNTKINTDIDTAKNVADNLRKITGANK